MEIKIISNYNGELVRELDVDSFASNVDALKSFFAGELDVSFKVYNGERPSDEDDTVTCIANDVRNEESCTYKLFANEFDVSDVNSKKVEIFKYLLTKYFPCMSLYNRQANDDNYKMFASYYRGMCHFKYCLPLDLAKKAIVGRGGIGISIDLSKLSSDELATYFIPQYYNEIGWWDRKFLRDDAAVMSELAVSWFEKAKRGSQD